MISKEFLKEKGVEEKYQEAIRRIQRHQQSAQLSYEIIFWVILGGFGINLIASAIYDVAIEWNILRHEILVLLLIFMMVIYLLSYGKFIDFKPKQRVQFGIEYRLQDRKDFGFKIDDLLLYLKESFTQEDFILWYDSFKNELINNKAIVFTHLFDFKYKADMDSMHGKVLSFIGNQDKVKILLEIHTYPHSFLYPPIGLSMFFIINYIILNPETPDSHQLLYHLKGIIMSLAIEEHTYVIINTLRPFMEKISELD